MRIYTLTKTYTQESFSPMEVKTFVSKEKAHNEMIKQVFDYLQKFNYGATMEELSSEYGYENGDVCVGYDYASIGTSTMLWEIFVTEISAKDALIAIFVEGMHKQYVLPKRVDETIYRLANEYTKEKLMSAIADFNGFKNDCFIGEALYENAIAQLGGKTDEQSYQAIANYLDNDFVTKEMANPLYFDYSDIHYDVPKMDSHNKWLLGMLLLAGGQESIVHNVRVSVNEINDDVFADELAPEIYKDMLCPDHRAKSSKLNDHEYCKFVKQICNKEAIEMMLKGKDTNSYQDKTTINWIGMYERLMEIFREAGYDRIAELNEANHTFVFSINDEYDFEPITIDCDDYAFGEFLDDYGKENQ